MFKRLIGLLDNFILTLREPYVNNNPLIKTKVVSKELFNESITVVDDDDIIYDLDDVPHLYLDAITRLSVVWIQYDDDEEEYFVVKVEYPT